MIKKATLINLYRHEHRSMQEIASMLGCSTNRVSYWMRIHGIQRRSIGDAVYLRKNPDGDPFKFTRPKKMEEAILYGVGIGLYWGEGNKANKCSVRIGNTDPRLIKIFINFLEKTFNIKRGDLRFSLQIFSDTDINTAEQYWTNALNIQSSQFTKTTVTQSGSIGTYKNKSQFGVITVYYHNRRLRDVLIEQLMSITPL